MVRFCLCVGVMKGALLTGLEAYSWSFSVPNLIMSPLCIVALPSVQMGSLSLF